MPRRFPCLFLIPALLLVAADRKADTEPPTPAPPKADVRGKITSLVGLKPQGFYRIRVEGAKEKDTSYDKASVRLTKETKFYRWADGKKKDAKVGDLKEGQKVQCVFVGPVAESYPVQAAAGEVLILEDPKK